MPELPDLVYLENRLNSIITDKKITDFKIKEPVVFRILISRGIDEVEKAGEPIDVKVRGHLKVRNRKDQLCPRCGTTIRRAGVLGYDTFYCPNCQPAARKQFIKWQ